MDFEQLAQSYKGDAANAYDKERSSRKKWIAEQSIVENLLVTLPRGSSVIDIPIGTGRFIDLYHRLQLAATGMDISPDMIAIAAGKAKKIGLMIPLYTADIRKINAADGAFDTAVCICFLNWIDIILLKR
jgi:ubiquinone/menaquinone biosynthesis C-methylase UbiE